MLETRYSTLRADIEAWCVSGSPPSIASLVVYDGYDVVEKEFAVRTFSGKTWAKMLEHIKATHAASYAEEWSVLEPSAFRYYARAFLFRLVDALEAGYAGDVMDVLAGFRHVLKIHGAEMFVPHECTILTRVCDAVTAEVWERGTDPRGVAAFEILGESILDDALAITAFLSKAAGGAP